MQTNPFVELRGEVDGDDVAIMDAVAQATPGASRMSLLREIIRDWADRERHRSRLVQNACRSNGSEGEADRNRTGNGPAAGRGGRR